MSELDLKVFDSHFHGYGISGKGEDWTPKIREILEGGEICGMLCCTDLRCRHEDFEETNKTLLELAKEKGRKILPLAAMLHPDKNASWRRHAEKWFDNHAELSAIKMKPEIGGIPVHPDYMDPVFEFANERDIPIVTHTQPERAYSAINYIESLKKFRKTKLVLYHASLNEEAAYLAASFPNVYVEPSWLAFNPNFFHMIGNFGAYSKMLAGTDGPGWFAGFKGSPYEDLVSRAKELIRPGNEQAITDFCRNNALRLLNI